MTRREHSGHQKAIGRLRKIAPRRATLCTWRRATLCKGARSAEPASKDRGDQARLLPFFQYLQLGRFREFWTCSTPQGNSRPLTCSFAGGSGFASRAGNRKRDKPMTSVDHRSEVRPGKTVSPPIGAGTRKVPVADAARPGTEAQGWRPPDLAAVEELLQRLARAVRQFHTYPPTSPLCVDAIAACHKASVSLQGRGQLIFRVTPRELLVDDVGIGAGTVIEHELVRRLHRAHVGGLAVDRGASPRDFSQFCSDLIRCHDAATKTSLAELLASHGVDKIVPRMTPRPEVLAIGAPPAPLRSLVEHERSRRQALLVPGGAFNHMYPPDKGWVRLDPAASSDAISLADLAILVEDPAEFATMLLRLTDDDPAGSGAHQTALEQKFSDVATLFASLDPRLARLMFAKLARAVLDLEPERRKELLQRTILPGLLDGRVDGTVLKDFPDLDLAESLCLLLELETAAPEVLTAALNRLELPEDRRMTVVPLLEARLRGGELAGTSAEARQKESSIDRFARKLIRIDPADGKSFAEFAAFDLSIDGQTAATIARVRETIGTTDLLVIQLECLSSLVRLEPNPSVVKMFLGRILGPLEELERASRWADLATWIARYWQLADAVREPRPEVAEAIGKALDAFCTRDHAMRLIELYDTDVKGRAAAGALLEAFGVAIAPVLVALFDDPAVQSKVLPLVQLMSEHAKLLGPALAAQVGRGGIAATRAIVGVLGFAGAGYETAVAAQLGHRDEQTVREALRALARIGTSRAAAAVAVQIRDGSRSVQDIAEEALWGFPASQANAQLRELIARRDFVLHNPQIAERLLDRATRTKVSGLEQALAGLAPLRFRFWNPSLMRVGRKARELLG